MRSRRLGAGAAAIIAACAVVPASAGAAQPGDWVVVLRDGATTTPAQAADAARRQGAAVRFTYRSALRGYAGTLPDALVAALRRDRDVASVSRDRPVRAVGTQAAPPSWGLDRVDQRTLPLNGSYTYPRTATGVDAYVIDSGVRSTHLDFGGRVRAGLDSVDGGAPADCDGHGTHVAGTLGGSAYGVAKAVSLVAVRVLDCGGSGSSSGVIAGIDWAARDHAAGRPAVANLSLGTSFGADSAMDAAVRGLVADGVSVSVAAGNGVGNGLYPGNACNTSPARVGEAITVSNTDRTDTRAFAANIGSCVDLFAPGTGIVSASVGSDSGATTMSGTSMSSPHVAGTAAMYLEANPAATPAQVAQAIAANATYGVVKNPGSGSPNRLLYTGFISAGSTPPANVAPAASFTASCAGLTCNFADTSTDSDGTIASRSWAFGDGGTATGATASRTYAAGGTYTVTLTVTDDDGAQATASRAVTVSDGSADPDPGTPTLTSGVAAGGTSAAAGGFRYYKIAVPAGASQVRLELNGPSCGLVACNPDLDLYGRPGAKPTTSAWVCRSATGSNAETCTIAGPPAGYVYLGVHTYSGASGRWFSVKATVS